MSPSDLKSNNTNFGMSPDVDNHKSNRFATAAGAVAEAGDPDGIYNNDYYNGVVHTAIPDIDHYQLEVQNKQKARSAANARRTGVKRPRSSPDVSGSAAAPNGNADPISAAALDSADLADSSTPASVADTPKAILEVSQSFIYSCKIG